MRKSTRNSCKGSKLSPYFIRRLSSWLVLSTALTLVSSSAVRGAAVAWDGNSASGVIGDGVSWLDANNWSADTLPSGVTPGDDLTFGAGTVGTINLGGNRIANSIVFSAGFALSTLATADQLTITTGVVTANAAATINSVIVGAAGLTLQAGSTGSLTLSADNSGTLFGPIAVAGGTLIVSADNNLGDAFNGVTISNGATLSAAGSFASARAVTLGTGGGRIGVTGVNTLILSTGLTANANALTKIGNGKLTLTADSLRTGTTTVSAGTLSANVATGTNALGSGNVTLSGGTLELTPVASQVAGISGRVFSYVNTVTLGDSSRFDYTNTAASTRIDPNLDYNGITPLSDRFAAQWLGKIRITLGGVYNFGTASDDGSRLFIDGVLIINNDGPKGVTDSQNTVTLSAGLHDVRVDFMQGIGGAGEILRYSGLDQAVYGAVPGAVLYQAESNTVAAASNAVVMGNNVSVTASSAINLNGAEFTQVQIGDLAQTTGTTLTVTGLAGKTLRVGGTATLGTGAGTVTIDTVPNIAFDGVATDSGNAMTITKLGAGRLIFDQTAVANTLGASTNLNIQGGSLVLVGSTAGGAFNPIGSAGITLGGAGASLILDTKGATFTGGGSTYSNNITVTAGGATIQNIANAATTTLTGTLAVGASGVTLDAIAGGQPATDPGANLLISGPITGSGPLNIVSTRLGSFVTSQLGTVTINGNLAGYSGTINVASAAALVRNVAGAGAATVNLAGGGFASYLFDADGSGTPGSSPIASQNTGSQNAAFGDGYTISGSGTATITAGRLATTFAPNFIQAQNKTARLGALSIGAQTLVINNNNGYGVDFTGAASITGAATFSPTTVTASNVVPGLTLSGLVSSTGSFATTKAGAGTLLLSNTGNTFTGDITVTAGALAVTGDGSLGAGANQVILNGAGATLRAVGTGGIATSRTIQINSAANSFLEVAGGQTLTMNTAFGGAAGAGWTKADSGILILNAANANTGPSTINGGIVRITNGTALGTTATAIVSVSPGVAATGAALQLANNITVANPLNLQGTNNVLSGGVNFGGQLENFSGTNFTTGVITLNFGAAIGATSGILNINGGINNSTTTARTISLIGAGTINVNSSLTAATATANQYSALQKFGSGTLNFTTAQPATPTVSLTFFGGTTNFSGNGSMIVAPTIAATVNPGAILNLDNTATNIADRLGVTRPVTLQAGTFNFTANAAGTATTLGVLTSNFASTISSNQAGAGAASLTFASAAFGGNGASLTFSGANLGTANNKIIITAAPTLSPVTSGILARAIITSGGGFDFVSYNHNGAAANTNGIQAFTLYNAGNNIDSAVTTDTLNFTAAPTFSAVKTINGFKITGTGINVAATGTVGNTPTQLTLTSGGIAVTGGSNTISVPALLTAAEIFAHVNTGSTLTLTSALGAGAVGFTKADGGTLILAPVASAIAGITPSNITGTFNHNGGTLQLGSNNAYTPNQFLRMGPGAILDLNGKLQNFRGILTDTGLEEVTPGQFGTITSVAGTGNLVTNLDNSARSWAGQITGTVNLLRSGENTWSVFSNNTYTGNTIFNGSTTTLRDGGRLSGTDSIGIQFATLLLDNNAGFRDEGNRIKDTATVTLRGGVINLTGRAQTASSETIGALVLGQGSNNITVTTGGTGVNSADLIFGSLTQQNSATINVNTLNGQIGSAGRLIFTTAPTLTNGILPYAVSGGNDLITYIPGLGIASISAVGARGYDGTAFPATFTNGTQNLKLSNNTFTVPDAPSGSYELNAISWGTNTAGQSINFTDGTDVLNLASGLLNKTGNFVGTIGATLDSGRLTAGGNVAATGLTQNLYITMNTGGNALTVNSRIVNNTNGDAVRLVYTPYNGATLSLANNLNSYTGGTVVNGGVAFTGTLNVGATGIIPAGGLTINQATVTQTLGGVINASNAPVLNGGAVLTLTGNNTLAGLTFNNIGGSTTAPTVNTSTAAAGTLGTLTIGASGITGTSSNLSSTSQVVGRVDFGATAKTLALDPIAFNGVDINPTQGTLALQGIVGSTGGITKTGNGSLTLNAQQVYTGPTNVLAGGIITNLSNVALLTGPVSGSRFSAYTFASGTTLNLVNDAMIGSLAGAGVVTNSSTTDRTFGTGFDNTSTIFSGQFLRFSDARLTPFTVNKFGTGTMTLTGISNNNNNLVIRAGGVTFSGAGRATFGTNQIFSTGTLTLDNRNAAGGNQNSRLGGATAVGTLTPNGGSLVIFGNETAATPTTETIGTLTFASGGSIVTLNAHANNPLTLTVGTTFSGVQGGGAALLRGDNFGNAPGNGVPTVSIGALGLATTAGAGAGANGTQVMPIRPDLIGGDTAASLGTAFITKDSAGNYLRPLTVAEMATTLSTATIATTNVALSAGTPVTGSAPGGTGTSQNTAFSLVLNSGGGVSLGSGPAFGLYSGAAGLVQTKIGSGGFLALAGNTGIISGQIDTSNNTAFHFHTVGAATTLALNGYLGTTNGGLTKSDAGSVSIDKLSYYTGTTTVNAGLLSIGTGLSNTIQVVATAGTPTLSALRVNGGAFELNGTSQMVGTIDSNNFPTGGSIRNTAGGPAVTLSTVTGAGVSFGGSIDGNLNFVKTGNNEMILTSASTYAGSTTIRGNNLRLRDGATLASTSYDINYGSLVLDNSALTPLANLNPVRVPAASTVNLRGGTILLLAGGSTDTTATLNAVTAAQGHNTLNSGNGGATTAASTAVLSVGNLIRSSADVTVNFVGGTSGFLSSTPGFGVGQVFVTSLNGVAIPADITNKILGGWALANNGEFVTNVLPGTAGNAAGINYGIATMNSNFAGVGQTSYDFNQAALPASSATANVRLSTAGTAAVPTGGAGYNVLAVRAAVTAITFTAGTDPLNLTAGGLALTNGGTVVGTVALPGKIVAGGTATGVSPLYLYSGGASNTINSVIADNGAVGALTRLVAVPLANSLILTAVNTYTGGTVVNGSGGTLNLNGLAANTIPAGGLTLNNALVTMTTTAGQIESSNVVTLNGGSSLTMFGTNTLPKVIFNNTGGFAATPTVATATSLILSAADAITATNDNLGSVPTISGTALTLSNALPVISASGDVPTALVISAPIISAGGVISKTGTGSLALSGANTFTTGFNLDQGTLIFGVASVGTPPVITSGPVGTGTLSLANNTTIFSTNNFTIGNAVSVAGNFTFGGTTTIGTNHNLTLSGIVTLGAGAHTITVSSPFVSDTISGLLTGGTNLTKAGPGTLTLSAANSYGGTTSITGGVLKLGAVAAIPAATSDASISAGAVLDVNGQINVVLRGISGAGLITNSNATGRTLYLGGIATNDNASTTSSTFDGVITNAQGALAIYKVGRGTVTLTGASSFTGNVNIGTSGSVNGGQLQITNSLALGAGAKTVSIISNSTGDGLNNAQLLLDGSTGNGPVVLGSNIGFTLSQGSLAQPTIVNVAGNNIINGNSTITSGGGSASLSSTSGSLTAAGNFTTNINGRFLYLSGASTGANTVSGSIGQGSVPNLLQVQKLDAGTWSLSGTTANTYTGLTTVTGGILALAKTAGIDAIAGDGVTDKVTDILVNGGTLRWDANHQVGDLVAINMTSGAVNVNGKTETIYDLNVSGGAFATGVGANFTVTDPTLSGGSSTITAASTATFGTLAISGGTNTVEGKGVQASAAVLNVGAGGLSFSGTASPTLTLTSDATSAGKLVLSGNVTSTVTAGTAAIANGGAGSVKGTVDLNGATRTISVADGTASTDLAIGANVIGAAGSAINKTGLGALALNGVQDYPVLTTTAGVTNVNGSFTNGTSTVNANATTNFGASQTLGALNIGAGAVVTFGSGPFAFTGDGGGKAAASSVVPEPGSVGLLLVGALGILGRRRREARVS